MMKKSASFLVYCAALLVVTSRAQAQVVISQVFGGGGNSGAPYTNDFVELYNAGTSAVTMTNWQVAYASSTGTSWVNRTIFSGTIPANGYFLIQEIAGGTAGGPLPAPDVTGGAINLSAVAGKVALLNNSGLIPAVACPQTAVSVLDVVSYGPAATACQGSPALAPSNTTSIVRKPGNANTANNSNDFQIANPPNPRNSGSSTTLSISQLSPNSVIVGSPATNITITGVAFGPDSTVNFTGQPPLLPLAANLTPTSLVVTVPASYLATVSTPSLSVTSGGVTSNALTFAVSSATRTCTETATIAQIQGTGRRSPYVSTTVQNTSSGIVTYKKSSGFFMQMAAGDGDPNTSDAIYVFTNSAPTVNLGDSVCVTGLISEYYNGGAVILTDPDNTLTEYSSVTVSTLSTGNPLPAPVTLNPDPNGTFDQLEKYEGMRVAVPSLTVTGPGGASAIGSNAEANGTYSPSGAFWGTVSGVARPFREPGIDASHPIYVENATGATYHLLPSSPQVFDANPERLQIYTGNPGSTVLDVSAGAVVTNLSGVLDVFYGDYELDEDPATAPGYVAPTVSNNSPVFTAIPQQNASELTIATYNLERFFDDQLNGTNTPFELVLATPVYQGRLAKASLAIRNVLRNPDILAVQEAENLGVLQSLAAKISSDAIAAGQTGPAYTAYLATGNDPGGINVGFLVNARRVTNITATQYFFNDSYSGNTRTFDRPPLVLNATAQNPGKAPLPVTVIVNHLKALPDDDPTSFGTTGTPQKRQAEAQSLAQLIQDLQTANPRIILAVVGDLNAFEFSDGVNDIVGALTGNPAPASQVIRPNTNLVSPALTELATALLPGNERQSYTEAGNAQQLDHILLSTGAFARLSRFAIGRLDADFRRSLHYDYTRPERLSDHDPEVAYLSLPAASEVTASVTVAVSGLAFNRGTQTYSGSITLTNHSSAAIDGPVQILFNNLYLGATLLNAAGSLGGTIPYLTAPAALSPGAAVTLAVSFRVQPGSHVSYTNTIFTGTL